MADDADRTADRMEKEDAMREAARPALPYEPPAGTPGDCDICNEWCGRLVGGACAPCRDKFKLP
ncbi:MAG: hypothetical protein Q8K57_13335 [Thiobacillus sp.]|nr:hypothetical protein [Thiobacillus sp.]